MELCQQQGELGFERGTGRGESLRVSRWGAPGQGLEKGPIGLPQSLGPLRASTPAHHCPPGR